ncbi:MAG: ATP-dependent Clp protease adaptor ClpS [Nitrospirae bacterium]|nr:ATP-dependent Clp protease adaptor ClpS [Nitrospirota bacterium]MBI3352822.1 ATP-dependent Clp protease adaptor ClpS [Nitrospirota bacterium]
MPTVPETAPLETIDSSFQIEPVRLYKVIFLNDDVTTFDFVVKILLAIFQKGYPTAVKLMLEVHQTGSAHVTTLPKEQAEFRQVQVHDAAKKEGFPFRCVIEPE